MLRRSFSPRSEEGGPKPHHCRAFFYGDLVVVRHPHRQLLSRMSGLHQCSTRFASLRECAMKLRFRRGKASYCHHSTNSDPRERDESLSLGQKIGESVAALGRLSRKIQLDQHIDRSTAVEPERAYGVGQPRTIERVQQHELLQRLHFIPLQMSDQMPANWHIDSGHLLQRFLNFVLADVPQTSFVRRLNDVGAVRLRDCDESDFLPVPTPPRSRVDSGPYVSYTLSQARKSHNC